MIAASRFIEAAKVYGYNLYTGVPCSYLKPFINYVIDAPDLHYVGAANEGDAVAIAAGAELAGQRAVVMFQNSGLGNAVNPLTSLCYTFQLPVLVIVTLRGEPGGPADEPQHELMGKITTQLLELMEIPWEYFPQQSDQVDEVLARANAYMQEHARPYALVMQKDAVEPHELESNVLTKAPNTQVLSRDDLGAETTRRQVLKKIQASLANDVAIIATTGYTGRELYACEDRRNQFYMVGSMGCASSFALGIALTCPRRKVVVLDGDGAALMRLGALATIGYEAPPNLVHVLLDNQVHESTGGQATVAHSIDFSSIASACGYAQVQAASTLEELESFILADQRGPAFLHMLIAQGVAKDLPRPVITPVEVAQRMRQFLKTSC